MPDYSKITPDEMVPLDIAREDMAQFQEAFKGLVKVMEAFYGLQGQGIAHLEKISADATKRIGPIRKELERIRGLQSSFVKVTEPNGKFNTERKVDVPKQKHISDLEQQIGRDEQDIKEYSKKIDEIKGSIAQYKGDKKTGGRSAKRELAEVYNKSGLEMTEKLITHLKERLPHPEHELNILTSFDHFFSESFMELCVREHNIAAALIGIKAIAKEHYAGQEADDEMIEEQIRDMVVVYGHEFLPDLIATLKKDRKDFRSEHKEFSDYSCVVVQRAGRRWDARNSSLQDTLRGMNEPIGALPQEPQPTATG